MSIKLFTERASTYAWTLQRHEATTRPTYKLAASGASGGSLVPGELFIEDFTVLQLLLGPKLYYDAPCRLNLDGILLSHSTGAITRIPRSSLGSSGHHPLGSAPAFFVASFCHQVISARICALPVFHPWYLWGCGGRPIAGCEYNQHSEPVTRRSRNLPLGTVYFILTLLPS